jgi:hypothetical protein
MVSFLNSVGISPPNFNFADESRLRGRELFPTSDLTNRRYTMARDRVQERGKSSTSSPLLFNVSNSLREEKGSPGRRSLSRTPSAK